MSEIRTLRLGDLLMADNLINQQQLDHALKQQKQTGLKLGQQLIADGVLSLSQINGLLAKQLGVPYIHIKEIEIKEEFIKRLPEMIARRCRAVVLGKGRDEQLVVGMSDPTNIYAYDEIVRSLQQPFRMAVVDEHDVLAILQEHYHSAGVLDGVTAEFETSITPSGESDEEAIEEDLTDAPVVRFIETMFEDALQLRASDIHIEPVGNGLSIRFRQDGVLHIQLRANKKIASPLLSKLKLLAGLDISEKRLPQDGRFQFELTHQKVDVRLSTLPIHGGREQAVLRLLSQSQQVLNLQSSGMSDELLERVRRLIHSPHGVLLVTGPTGSGKTTTLYGALSELNKTDVKILTVEDPVEYQLDGISQVQVNHQIGLNFSTVLRAFLRQDPDIILVGEMRDQETVETAMRAAMTGHLVLSSMHTNDAISTPLRLLDMGTEPFLISSALKGVLAQRLVRRLCERCSEPANISIEVKQYLQRYIGNRVEKIPFRTAVGCDYCEGTGYKGRVGLFELMELNSQVRALLNSNDVTAYQRAARNQPGFKSLFVSALELAAKGVISIGEVLKVAYGMED